MTAEDRTMTETRTAGGQPPFEPPAVRTVKGVSAIGMRRTEAAAYCGLSLATWDRFRAAGRTPRPVFEHCDRRQVRMAVWLVSDLERWARAGFPFPDEAARSAPARPKSRKAAS